MFTIIHCNDCCKTLCIACNFSSQACRQSPKTTVIWRQTSVEFLSPGAKKQTRRQLQSGWSAAIPLILLNQYKFLVMPHFLYCAESWNRFHRILENVENVSRVTKLISELAGKLYKELYTFRKSFVSTYWPKIGDGLWKRQLSATWIWHRGVYWNWPARGQHQMGAESDTYDCLV